ncbi:MAG: PHP domain-containing protein, partial [Nitrospiria bacterium]
MSLEGYKDLRGAIHVHSYISHDSRGTPEEIIQGAKETDLDFIVMTDHDSPRIFKEGMQGRYEGVLVIRGMEVIKGCRGTADMCASVLAIGLANYFDHRPLTFQQVLDEVNGQGGIAFVAHPRGWQDWS